MPRDNICMYMAHVCFYVCCSDYVGSVFMFIMFIMYRSLLKIVVLEHCSVEICCMFV